jgi:hypothetical protein
MITLRDGNEVSLNAPRYWEIWLEDVNNNFVRFKTGTSTGGSQLGWSTRTYAGCDTGSGTSQFGYCETDWHT